MHEPTPPDRRAAALRFQAEQLLRDAAAWGFAVAVVSHPPGQARNGPLLAFTPVADLVQPSPLMPRTRSA